MRDPNNALAERIEARAQERDRITTQHRQLEERETKIRRLVDISIIGIVICDLDGQILGANDAFLHMMGYDPEDLAPGRLRWTDLTPPEWRGRDAEAVEELKRTGTMQPFEKEYFRKDGSRVPVLIGGVSFEEGGQEGVAFVLDLAERKRRGSRKHATVSGAIAKYRPSLRTSAASPPWDSSRPRSPTK